MFHARLHSFSRLVISLTLSLILSAGLASFGSDARAQDKRQNAPGEFDFYVLSLSWSPSFCEAARERGNTGRSQQVQFAIATGRADNGLRFACREPGEGPRGIAGAKQKDAHCHAVSLPRCARRAAVHSSRTESSSSAACRSFQSAVKA